MHTPPEMTCGFLIQLVFCKKKTMWFIGFEVEQETSAPPPEKNPGSAPETLDSAIHQINFYPTDNTIVSRNAYPVDTAVQRLNKRGLIGHLSRRDVISYEDS